MKRFHVEQTLVFDVFELVKEEKLGHLPLLSEKKIILNWKIKSDSHENLFWIYGWISFPLVNSNCQNNRNETFFRLEGQG